MFTSEGPLRTIGHFTVATLVFFSKDCRSTENRNAKDYYRTLLQRKKETRVVKGLRDATIQRLEDDYSSSSSRCRSLCFVD